MTRPQKSGNGGEDLNRDNGIPEVRRSRQDVERVALTAEETMREAEESIGRGLLKLAQNRRRLRKV